MKTLVGKYLVCEVATGYTNKRAIWWRATWFLHQSPSGTGRDWEVFENGEERGPFTTERHAIAAAHATGVTRARVIQNDMHLRELSWRPPFPDVPA
jgi:hypothetical protein